MPLEIPDSSFSRRANHIVQGAVIGWLHRNVYKSKGYLSFSMEHSHPCARLITLDVIIEVNINIIPRIHSSLSDI